jgi:hypothetical protein
MAMFNAAPEQRNRPWSELNRIIQLGCFDRRDPAHGG